MLTSWVGAIATTGVEKQSSGIRRFPLRHDLRIVVAHRQQQTTQNPDIRVKACCSHIPHIIYYIHFGLFEGLAVGFRLRLKVWALERLMLASI